MAQPESAVVNGLNWSLELQFGVQWSSSNGNNSNSSSSWYGNPDRGTPLMLETWCLCGFLCNSPWELGGVAIVQVSLRFRWQLRIESFNRRDPIQQLQHVDHRSTDTWFSVFSFSFLFRLQSQSQAHLHTHVLICSLTQILTYSDTHIFRYLHRDWIGLDRRQSVNCVWPSECENCCNRWTHEVRMIHMDGDPSSLGSPSPWNRGLGQSTDRIGGSMVEVLQTDFHCPMERLS